MARIKLDATYQCASSLRKETSMYMIDPSCTGDLRLPELRSYTSEELVKRGPLNLLATPKERDDGGPPEPTPAIENDGLRSSTYRLKAPEPGTRSAVWIESPSAPGVQGDIWHYSDAAGLIGMISQNQIWATSLAHLNDSNTVVKY